MKISCVTASYVADLLGYPGEIDWGLASERIVQAGVMETIESILKRLEPARLDGIEFWYPHVWPGNLTPALAGEIRKRLAKQGMVCCACAGTVSNPTEDPYGATALFETTRLVGAPLIAGHLQPEAIPAIGKLCANFSIRAAYENGGEKDVAEIQTAIREGNEWIGANIDTGNMAAAGGDPLKAIRVLGPRITHVHLKDVAMGTHNCVALGQGIVDLKGVIRELKTIGYAGWLSIEIETEDHDPTNEIIASADTLRSLI